MNDMLTVAIVWALVATAVAVSESVFTVLLIQMHKRERAEWERLANRIDGAWTVAMERTHNMQAMGSASPPPATVFREIDAEERVQRMVSEATVQNGMQRLAAEYRAAGRRIPEDDALRSEVLSMIGGEEPVIELQGPRD